MPCPLSECRRTAQTLNTLRRLSAALHATVEVPAIVDLLLQESVQMAGAEGGLVAICSGDGISGYRRFEGGALVHLGGWTPDDGAPGSVVLSVEPFFSNAPLNDPLVDRGRAAAYGVRCVASVPIGKPDGELVGYLEIHNKKDPAGFSACDLEPLLSVAQIAAQAVANARSYRKVADGAAQLEERVAQRTAQLQDMNEELENFANSVSHNLRAPLRAIHGFAQILLENGGAPDQAELLGRIQAAALSLDQLVEDLLGYSRAGRQELLSRTVNLTRVVREAEQQLKLSGEEHNLRVVVAEPLPQVRGDHAALVQVVFNLLSNAAKYVAPGAAPEVRVSAQKLDGLVRLQVQDNGIGIERADQERIFSPFERLHGTETYPGTGLGLAIARRAVHRLGGRIGVQSSPGEGSRFWVELPADQAGEK